MLSSAAISEEEDREPKGLTGGGEEVKLSGDEDAKVDTAPLSKGLDDGGEEANPSGGAEGKPSVVASRGASLGPDSR